jgi:ribulose 1,5-bisphosphate carboxylase large subunit-like protein/acyl carrier protein
MNAEGTSIKVTFYFETARAVGTPDEVLTRMCHEQTTTGYDTLAGRAAAPRLAPYQASVQKLRLMPSTDEVDSGFAEIDFPWNSMSHTGNPLEDALCFVMGESSHVKGMLKLRMVDLSFPDDMMRTLGGPRHGVPGVRRILGVYDRPLLMGPMRPEVGLAPVEYAKIAYDALLAGSDIVKDDELLVDPPYCPMRERATLCAKAARDAEQKTGERKMWVLHLGCDVSRFDEFLKIGQDAKVDGYMVQPRLTPSLLTLMRSRTELPLIAHYSMLTLFTRYSHVGIEMSLMLKLFRMSGADIVTFPRPNPRFDVSSEEFTENLRVAGAPLGPILPAFPFPTGGNRAEDVGQCFSVLGNFDYGFVAGSAMFEEPGGICVGAQNLRVALERLSATAKSAEPGSVDPSGQGTSQTDRPMTVQELYSIVSPLAEQVLHIPKFDDATNTVSTASWDSLRHIQLLGAVERKFGIEISGDDSFRLTSADKLIQYLHTRLQQEVRE